LDGKRGLLQGKFCVLIKAVEVEGGARGDGLWNFDMWDSLLRVKIVRA